MSYLNFFESGSMYGSYRTRYFSQIFPTFEEFLATWEETNFSKQASALLQEIPDLNTGNNGPQNLKLIYELLLSEYANRRIASSDEDHFKLNCMSIIFQYGPAFVKRLEIQHTLHLMDPNSEEFLRGSEQILNTALNPSEDPSTDTLEHLSYINQQNVNIQKRDKFKSLAILDGLLSTDYTQEFLNRFKPLFRKSAFSTQPLFYITEEYNND